MATLNDEPGITELTFNSPQCTLLVSKKSDKFCFWHHFDRNITDDTVSCHNIERSLWDALLARKLSPDNPGYNQVLAKSIHQAYASDLWFEIGLKFYTDEDLPDEFERSLMYFQKASNQNDCLYNKAQAAHLLGLMFLRGDGTKMNPQKAYSYFRAVADQKDNKRAAAESCKELGNMHLHAIIGQIDYKKALEYYERAAFQNDNLAAQASACVCLGHFFCGENGSPVDHDKALSFFKKAAEQTISPKARAAAWSALGKMNLVGKGVSINLDEAFRYCDLAAEQREHREICLMAMTLKAGRQEILQLPPDEQLAQLEELANQETRAWVRAMAWLRIGELYLKYGNIREAARLFERVALQEDDVEARARACYHLADLFGKCNEGDDAKKAFQYRVIADRLRHSIKLSLEMTPLHVVKK